MVAEARAVRERILTDMARRRNHARQQLERLRAGRERLLDAIEAVRATAEQVAGELSGSLVEARLAGERAGRQVDVDTIPSLNELDAEVELAKDAGLIDLDAIERELMAEPADRGVDLAGAGPSWSRWTPTRTGGRRSAETEGVVGEPERPRHELVWAVDGGNRAGDRRSAASTTPIVDGPRRSTGTDVGTPPTADGSPRRRRRPAGRRSTVGPKAAEPASATGRRRAEPAGPPERRTAPTRGGRRRRRQRRSRPRRTPTDGLAEDGRHRRAAVGRLRAASRGRGANRPPRRRTGRRHPRRPTPAGRSAPRSGE